MYNSIFIQLYGSLMSIKFGKTYYPKEYEKLVGTWVKGRYRIHSAASIWSEDGTFYLQYLGSPNNRFVGESVTVEIEQEEYELAINGQLDWEYFHEIYVTC